MKLVKPYAEIIDQEPTLDGVFKMSELAARTCYASTDKIGTSDTKDFLMHIFEMGHGEPLECNAIYLKWDLVTEDYDHNRFNRYRSNEYSRVKTYNDDTFCYVTTNYRVLLDNGWLKDLEYMSEPTDKHELRITVRFNTQIVISSEINRYRKNSKGQRSTRYCNYSKDKYGNEISVSWPTDISDEDYYDLKPVGFWDYVDFLNRVPSEMKDIDWWWFANLACEEAYMQLVNTHKWKAQQARKILPLDTNTEMIHTAYLTDWKHFLAQRSNETTGPAHPDIKVLADSLKQQFISRGYIREEEPLK